MGLLCDVDKPSVLTSSNIGNITSADAVIPIICV